MRNVRGVGNVSFVGGVDQQMILLQVKMADLEVELFQEALVKEFLDKEIMEVLVLELEPILINAAVAEVQEE